MSHLLASVPHSSVGKESTCNAGDPSWIPGSGRSPGEGKGYPLQYSGLENSVDNIAHGVTKSRTRLNDFQFHFLASVGSFRLSPFFFFFATPCDMWDLNSLTRDRSCTNCIGRLSLNHWTIAEVLLICPYCYLKFFSLSSVRCYDLILYIYCTRTGTNLSPRSPGPSELLFSC